MFGFEIKRNGSVYALTEPAHRGRAVGQVVYIGVVRRFGSGYAGYTTTDVEFPTYSGCRKQWQAASNLYYGWLDAGKPGQRLPVGLAR